MFFAASGTLYCSSMANTGWNDVDMTDNPDDPVMIFSTASPDNARDIAHAVIGRHLAACVNCTPVRSLYRWKGEICDDEEVLMIIKTVRSRAEELIAAIRTLHTYEVPEIVLLPLIGGYYPYLAWIREETTS
jgi:periplasmic divalent cation tolerance protein